MQAIKTEAVPYLKAEQASLEELACLKMDNLAHKGAGFHAYAQIVNRVQAVHMAENRAHLARAKAMQELTKNDEY